MSFKKITFSIFFIITASMAGLFFGQPLLAGQPQNILIAAYAGAALIISLVLSLVVYGLGKGPSGEKAKKEKAVPAPEPEKAPFDEKTVQLLALLQKKGRFIDFLQEDISSYEDSQIGAAVRNIHKGCNDAIHEYIRIEPVMNEPEGNDVTVEEGFDPSAVRITGNIAGSPPFKGVLRHNGWRVSGTTLPRLPENQDLSIIEPAEVEI